jgi:hypothetical protein
VLLRRLAHSLEAQNWTAIVLASALADPELAAR